EMHDAAQPRGVLARFQPALGARLFQAVQAHVVGAALQQRRHRARRERLSHRGQIAVEELVLQRLGAGGDDDLAARKQRRDEIGEGFPGTGAGFDREHAAGPDGFEDRLRHLDLLLARVVVLHLRGKRTVRREHAPDRILRGVQRSSSTFTQMPLLLAAVRSRAERIPLSARAEALCAPPRSIHSPRRPLTLLTARWPWIAPPRLNASCWVAISSVILLPEILGMTAKPVPACP